MRTKRHDIAETRQHQGPSLLERLQADVSGLAAAVAGDLGPEVRPGAIEPIVERFLAAFAGGRRVSERELAALRADGAAAAREGRPLAEPLDAYLSTAWVAWERAVGLARAGGVDQVDLAAELAALGSSLLRAGDDVAAALADGYTGAERALAARAGATRRAVLDELLAPAVPGAAAGRLARRTALVGLDPALGYGLVVVRSVVELEDEGPAVEEVARRLARDPSRRPHLVSVRDGDLVILIAGPWRTPDPVERALAGLAGPAWWAASTVPDSLASLPRHSVEALDALRVLPACRPPGAAYPVASVALERSLVADPALAVAAVDLWLGPLAAAGRGSSELLPTLEAWLGEGRSVTGTARRLGVAPRTVTYRLERIARLLGRDELDAGARERLATALLTRRLLHAWPIGG